jgi:hypothetical protein
VRSQSTTAPSDTLDGQARLRMAIEGAARENIALGLERLGKLSLGAVRTRAQADAPAAGTAAVSIVPYADPRGSGRERLEETSLAPGR